MPPFLIPVNPIIKKSYQTRAVIEKAALSSTLSPRTLRRQPRRAHDDPRGRPADPVRRRRRLHGEPAPNRLHHGGANLGRHTGPTGVRGAWEGATAGHWCTAGIRIRRRISLTTDRDTPDRRLIS